MQVLFVFNPYIGREVMKQDMEFIKLIFQTLSDNESYFMMLRILAKH